MLPADHRGRPRCPTCFRRLRPVIYMDVLSCPSKRCPHNFALGLDYAVTRSYGVTGSELARARS